MKKRHLKRFAFNVCLLVIAVNVIIYYVEFWRNGEEIMQPVEYKEQDGSPFNFDLLEPDQPLDSAERIRKYRQERFDFFRTRNVSGLGEWGKFAALDDVAHEVVMETSKREKFNKLLSDRISLDRSLPDYRIAECKSLKYPVDLPRASVVVVFCNETPSVVLRTVHSVVNRSPPGYLHEVILVDDASDREDIKSQLPEHLRRAYPDGIAKLIRSEERLGLIRARMSGAREATGDVLVFLDAHCEVTLMWLEPLLNRIKEDKTVVVCPIIDLLTTHSLMFERNGDGAAGGFHWKLEFDWMPVQEKELMRRKNETYPIRSPAMAGGLFAVDRNYFFHLGGYDEGMEMWGGENVEISLRTWMCGGSLEIIPCSRVGHLYRGDFPYSFMGKKLDVNLKRLAEVWLDDYKRIFYLHRPDLKQLETGDLGSRHELKSRLKCHNFKWYLDNVYPELFVHDENVKAYGSVDLCWDSMGKGTSHSSYTVSLFSDQRGYSLHQLFSLDKKNKIRKDEKCLTARRDNEGLRLVMVRCSSDDGVTVNYDKQAGLMILETGECIEVSYDEKWKHDYLTASACTSQDNQKWRFQHLVE